MNAMAHVAQRMTADVLRDWDFGRGGQTLEETLRFWLLLF